MNDDYEQETVDVGQPILLPWMVDSTNFQNPHAMIVQQQIDLDMRSPTQQHEKLLTRETKPWSKQLFFRTGMCYFAGFTAGTAWGLASGATSPNGFPNMKLRLNSMLNGGGRTGSTLANRLGVLAFIYSIARSGLNNIRKKDDVYNQIGAGAAAGLLFAAPRGAMPALVGAATAGAVVAGLSFGSNYLEDNPQFESVTDFIIELL
jgi:inner membrane translocase subunit Tim23